MAKKGQNCADQRPGARLVFARCRARAHHAGRPGKSVATSGNAASSIHFHLAQATSGRAIRHHRCGAERKKSAPRARSLGETPAGAGGILLLISIIVWRYARPFSSSASRCRPGIAALTRRCRRRLLNKPPRILRRVQPATEGPTAPTRKTCGIFSTNSSNSRVPMPLNRFQGRSLWHLRPSRCAVHNARI